MDVHSHVYLPRYASFLRTRAVAPRIFSLPVPGEPGAEEDRLLILDNEPSGGRPVGPQVFLTQRDLANDGLSIPGPNFVCSIGIGLRSWRLWTSTGSMSPS